MSKIGVFDSGVGGLSVARALKESFGDHGVVYVNDRQNLPYGNKTPQELFKLVKPILIELENRGCEIIVVACNTVTTTIIDQLRSVTSIPLIGMEPMIKQAAETSTSSIIAVCATPTTLSSQRYKYLKDTYAKRIQVIEPNCSDWAKMIEEDTIDRKKIVDIVEDSCKLGADVIVLGCTHYHWIESLIVETTRGRAIVLQPEQTVIREVTLLLEQLR